jgi:flavin reductase (DIM6/NTAB) family NADH-FMN oxidoreductase RutF/catechol 2,3-dioxygenase-like lactoylglutathione lyase family enzyme
MPLDKWQWSPSPLPGQVMLVTSRDAAGRIDVAPKSWVTMVSMGDQPRLGFGCTLEHRTARNVRATGEFALSVPDQSLAGAVWDLPQAADRLAGWATSPARTVALPLIADCVAHLECRLDRLVELDGPEVFVIGILQRVAVDERAATAQSVADRYAQRPFFFLEAGWYAPLGAPRPVAAAGRPELGLVILGVEDVAPTRDFLTALFDWPVVVQAEGYCELAAGPARLGVYQRAGFLANLGGHHHLPEPADRALPVELYVEVPNVAAAVSRARALGARLLDPPAPRSWGDEAGYVTLPGGAVLALARRLIHP